MAAVTEEIRQDATAIPAGPVAASLGRVGPLPLAVFIGGISSLALEMTASRLLAPRFGTSLFIWADLIGLVLIFLSVGYWFGGRWADRAPVPARLYAILAAAGVAILAVPFLAGLLLDPVADLTASVTDLGAILAVILLFAVPTTLLGFVSPFAVRLRISAADQAGRTAGSLYALSTLGSIVGTFGTAFGTLPYFGITLTLVGAGVLLLLVAGLGWLVVRGQGSGVGGRGSDGQLSVVSNQASEENAQHATRNTQHATSNSLSTPHLLAAVGGAGAAIMALEMTASNLMRPYFGSSQLIWANLIGLVMIYLTVGYWLGGRVADRHPTLLALYSTLAGAAVATMIVPFLAQPLLTWSLEGFAKVSVSIFYGSLVGVIGLFAVPLTLLGMVSPLAIRLHTAGTQSAGSSAGAVYATSTLGSIVGTFVPVFLLLPNPAIASGRTLLIAAGVVLLIATLGMWAGRVPGARLAGAGLLVVAALSLLPRPALVKPPPYGEMIAERESVYNYIQVVRAPNGDINLVLNEGHAVHSTYRADRANPLTGGPWDYWLVAPYVTPDMTPDRVHSLLMLGSAAGTASQLFTQAYGPKRVDNVELDPEIVDLGHQYFHLPDGNVHNIVRDARVYLRTTDQKYTIVGIDAYRQPYIPFHLTTREFFAETKEHLEPGGVVMINAGRTATDYRLVNAIASTMRSVYPHVYIIDVATMGNSMVIGSDAPEGPANFRANAAGVTDPLLKQVFSAAIEKGNMREVQPAEVTGQPVFTDDRAPVEQVIDQLILNYVGSQ